MHWAGWRRWKPQIGARVLALVDIGGPLVTSVPAGTLGTVVEIRRRHRIMVSFTNGRTIEVGKSTVERLHPRLPAEPGED